MGKLDGIADQVGQNLAQPGRIGTNRLNIDLCYVQNKLNALLLSLKGHNFGEVRKEVM